MEKKPESEAESRQHRSFLTSFSTADRLTRAGFTNEQINKYMKETSWEKLEVENRVFLEERERENNPVYWCPLCDSELAFALGSVKNPPQVIETEVDYRLLLTKKVKDYLAYEPDPKKSVKSLRRKLDHLGVDPTVWDGSVENAPEALIHRNPMLTQVSRMRELELDFPVVADDSDIRAERAYKETSLEEWISLL